MTDSGQTERRADRIDSIEFEIAQNSDYVPDTFREALESLVEMSGEGLTSVNLAPTVSIGRSGNSAVDVSAGENDSLMLIVDTIQDSPERAYEFYKRTNAVRARWTSDDGRTHTVHLGHSKIAKPKTKKTPCLFISYASVDRKEVDELVKRIRESQAAEKTKLEVWWDLDQDLDRIPPASRFVDKLATAISETSTAFAVYLGKTGIVNWVKAEVDLALDRAIRDPTYAFIPILNKNPPERVLPGFTKLYQAIKGRVLENEDDFIRLIELATDTPEPCVVDEPFVGPRSFDEENSHLFFGRTAEVTAMVEILKKSRLMMVVGDSGSGKSSIVKAGLIPAFRGAELRDNTTYHLPWHVITTRPQNNPIVNLARNVSTAAESVGRSDKIERIRKSILENATNETIELAITDSGPDDSQILIVVDQFEEIFTLSKKQSRDRYVELLTYLVGDEGPPNVRIAITMRGDYYNLCSSYREFYRRLESTKPVVKYVVKSMSEAGLNECIVKPLKLAGRRSEDLFAKQVMLDVGQQPGNLAQLQMALYETWQDRGLHENLLDAYVNVGGLRGALPNFADKLIRSLCADDETDVEEEEQQQEKNHDVRWGDRDEGDEKEQPGDDKDRIRSKRAVRVLLRLAQLGDTGGATRRTASKEEFREEDWELVEQLSRQENRRLVVASGSGEEQKVELCHDALITQWPAYQTLLDRKSVFKRIHDRVISDATEWQQSAHDRGDLLSGNNLNDALSLRDTHADWLSGAETEFISKSYRRRILRKTLWSMAAAAIILFATIAGMASYLANQRFDLAKTAVNKSFVLVTKKIETQPEAIELFRESLKQSLELYGDLVDQPSPKAWFNRNAVLQEIARLHYRAGRLNELLGATPVLTLQSYETARAIQRKLSEGTTDDVLLADYGNTLNGIANVLHHKKETKPAIDMYGQAYAIRSRLVSTASKPTYQRKLANTLMNRAQVYEDLAESQLASTVDTQGSSDEFNRLIGSARTDHQEAQKIRDAILDENSSELDEDEALMVRHERAIGNYGLGDLDFRQKAFPSAIKKLADAITEAREVLVVNPDDHQLRYIRGLALTLRGEARIKSTQGTAEEEQGVNGAKNDYEEGREMLSPLAELYPKVNKYQTAVINTHKNLASIQYHQGQYADALESNRQLVTRYEKLIKGNPSDVTNRLYLGQTKLNLLYNLHELDRDEELSEQGIKLRLELDECHKQYPNDDFNVLIDHLDKILSDWGITPP